MNSSVVILILIITVLVITLLYVYYWKKDKERTVHHIQMVYDAVDKLMGSFVHKETEEIIHKQIDQLLLHIEKKKYSFEQINEFKSFANCFHEKVKKNNILVVEDRLMEPISQFKKLTDASSYITSRKAIEIEKQFGENTSFSDISYAEISELESDLIKEFKNIRTRKKELILQANAVYVENEKNEYKELFDNIDGKCLDDNQRNAVVNDDDRQLVVAGAGCGKTLTMAAKVSYLTEKKSVSKSDVLLLSFTRKAAEEMQDRLSRIGIDMESYTFHKLGLDIISKVRGKMPDVYDDIRACLDDYYREVLSTNRAEARNYLNLLGLMLLPNYDKGTSQGERMLADKSWSLASLKNMCQATENEKNRERLTKEIKELWNNRESLNEAGKTISANIETDNVIKILNSIQIIAVDDDRAKATISSIKRKLQSRKTQTPLESEDIIIKEVSDLIVAVIRNKERERTSLKNELLKSREEVKIANYLFLNGINYEYEAEYPFDEDYNYRKKYRPDFYLLDDDVFIEHFGIDKNGKAPQLSRVQEADYLNGIRWKRKIHKENGTKLIETYSWQFSDGVIEDYLNKKINELGIKTKEVDYNEIIGKLFESGEYHNSIDSVATLITTFIALFKSNNYGVSKFDELLKECRTKKKVKEDRAQMERNIAFLLVARSFYVYYSEFLAANGYIDFNDMINIAADYVATDAFAPNYKYVIVDEYQDISKGRYNLIKEILEKTGAKLFCVGDDWQSIYKFTGSEVSLFTDFGDYFGLYSRTDIVRTYRNSQELLDVAGTFIMKNDSQLRKELISSFHDISPVNILYYSMMDNILRENDDQPKSGQDNLEGKSNTLSYALERAISDIVKANPNSEILLLGRNNSDIDKVWLGTKLHRKTVEGKMILIHDDYPGTKMEFLTIHRAKGLERDNVILLNMVNSIAGFPNQMADDPVLDLLRNDNKESYPFAEERRLLYVALTRSKNKAYILSPNVNFSTFLEEIKKYPGVVQLGGCGVDNAIKCPDCETGYLVVRHNSAGDDFVGCTNYPMCTFTASDPRSIASGKRCPRCNGFLVEKIGKYGRFYGCTNYPNCHYTKDYDGEKKPYNNGHNNGSGTVRSRNIEPKDVPKGKKWFEYPDYQLNDLLESRACPKCKNGHFVLKYRYSGGGYLGCSNYPECTFVAKDPQAVVDNKRCPKCGSYLVKRALYHDNTEFYGCSNYPDCTYLESLDGVPFKKWSQIRHTH